MNKTKDIQRLFAKYLVESGREFLCENFSHTLAEMDICLLSKSNLIHEFEVKISRSDFLADKKKRKWSYYQQAFIDWKLPGQEFYVRKCPNYFFYVCPNRLIGIDEIPSYAGLYWVDDDGSITLKKKAKKLHYYTCDVEVIKKMLRYHTERKYIGACRVTVLNRANQNNFEKN